MHSEQTILDVLAREGLAPEGRIVFGGDTDIAFVPIAIARDTSGRQIPANSTLHRLASLLGQLGVNVQFLLRHERSEEIELGLRATILHSHIDHVRNVFASLEPARARVWIEPKHTLTEDQLLEIKARAHAFLQLFDITLAAILLTTEELLPSKLAMLSVIRQLSPASLPDIAQELARRGLPVPSTDWLARRLDALRKSSDVVRQSGGTYVLTRGALHRLGTVKSRRSPDLSRLLALARRGS